MKSLNNRFVVEPYVSDGQIRVSGGSGFQRIEQKVAVKGLKLLVDFVGNLHGNYVDIKAGATVYIREEALHTQPWAKQMLESDAIEGRFMIVDASHVEFVKENI